MFLSAALCAPSLHIDRKVSTRSLAWRMHPVQSGNLLVKTVTLLKIEQGCEMLAVDISYKVTCWSHSTIYMQPEGISDPHHRKPINCLAIYWRNCRDSAKNDKNGEGLESPSVRRIWKAFPYLRRWMRANKAVNECSAWRGGMRRANLCLPQQPSGSQGAQLQAVQKGCQHPASWS